MKQYAGTSDCRMAFIRLSLDDSSATACGRCDNCAGSAASIAIPKAQIIRALDFIRRRPVEIEPRKMWPGGAFGARGMIPANLMAAPGRAMFYADAPEWRDLVAASFARDNGPTPELCTAAVTALTSWAARPHVVVALAAAGYPQLTGELADHLAAGGHLARAEMNVTVRPDDVAGLASAAEAALWRTGITIGPTAAAAVAGQVVLLLVDATSTTWPITVAAAHLRAAGAAMVLPLLIHRRP